MILKGWWKIKDFAKCLNTRGLTKTCRGGKGCCSREQPCGEVAAELKTTILREHNTSRLKIYRIRMSTFEITLVSWSSDKICATLSGHIIKLSFRARVTVMKTLNAAVACHVWQRGNLLKWILPLLELVFKKYVWDHFSVSCMRWHSPGGMWGVDDDCCERRSQKRISVISILMWYHTTSM